MIAAIRRLLKSKNPGPPPRRGYDAFISYSRGASEPLAGALERGLRHIARPWYQVGGLRMFRDRTGLGATPDLSKTLFKHIRASNFLLLIASKGAAASPWVEQELRHWFETLKRPADKAVVVLCDGEMPRWDIESGGFDPATTGTLPSAYLRNCRAEPAFVDMRWIDQSKALPTLKDARFLDQVADVATPLLGKDSKDEVISEEMKRRKQVRGVIAGAVALVVALAGAIFWQHDRQERMVRSETLAKRASELTRDSPDEALLFALAATNIYPTDNARRALLAATFRSSGLVGIARGHRAAISTLQFVGPTTLISADEKGELRTWNADPQSGVRESRPPLPLGIEFPKDESTGRVPNVKSTVVVAPGGQWALAVNSAEGQEDTITESRAAIIGLASAAPPLPPDLAQSFEYMSDTLVVAPDGQQLTLFSGIDQVKHWSVGSAAAAETATATERCFDQRVVSRDASIAVCKGFVGDPLTVWDLVTNQVIGKVPLAEDDDLSTMTTTEDGALLAIATQRALRVVPLRPAASTREQTFAVSGWVSALAFSPSGKRLAVSLDHGRLLVIGIDGHALKYIANFDLGDSATSSPAFSPDDRLVAVPTRKGGIEIWNLGQGYGPSLQLTSSRAHAALAVSSDESQVALASSDADAVHVVSHDLRTGSPTGITHAFRMPILGMGFDGNRLRVLGAGPQGESCPGIGSLSTLLVETIGADGSPPRETIASATRCDLTAARLAPKGVVTVAENGVALWREDTGAWTEIWNQQQRLYTNPEMTVSADGTRVAFAPLHPWEDNPKVEVQVWSLLEGSPHRLASLDQATPNLSIDLSGDGGVIGIRTIARIGLWKIDAGGSVTSLGNLGISEEHRPAALDRSGSRLALARTNGAIELWDTAGPSLVGTIPAPATPGQIAQLVFAGRYLLVVMQNGVTKRLDTQVQAWMQHACTLTVLLRTSGNDTKLLGEPTPPRICEIKPGIGQ